MIWIYLIESRDGLKRPFSFGGAVIELNKNIGNIATTAIMNYMRKSLPNGSTYYYDHNGVELSIEKWRLDG